MNHPIFRYLVLFLLILSNVFLSGCWDRQELNDLALVTAAGIDKKSDGTIELTVLTIVPKGEIVQQGTGGSSSVKTFVRKATGKTLAEAMSKLQEILPRQIFWGICKVFIIDEEVAKDGIGSHIDFIMRYPQIRESTNIFISSVKAKKVLSLLPPLERDISEVLRELVSLKIGMDVSTKDLAEMMISESGDLGVPWIKILPPEKGKGKQTIAYITGTAIFKKDKMIGHIDDSVTRGVLWLRDEIELSTVSLKPEETDGYISLKSLNVKTELIPKIENGKWKIVFKATTENDIIQNSTPLDASNPKVANKLQKLLEKRIEKKVEVALHVVQKDMKADIFGFAEAFHRKYPKIWKREKNNWDKIYPDVEVSYDIKSHVRRQGMNSINPKFPKNEVKEE
ncbi:Ger(x)C family spore germination protein [Neobacillus cucumis]|uniref:Ger(X)C family spore germination protein n=1 Tax=Neobacillus cucumis TaxID=1740721 RepID=A0A2N5H9Q0_9BACI|nr:Ger(x)C family spore germination protein [Neobacillus cucumis]PLS02251.1 Ger(x)C family spore germination protein [Neobacillus cucumis]